MPRTYLAADYSPEYEHLLRAATLAGAKPVVLQFITPSQTIAMRARVYAYFRALRVDNLRPDLAHLASLVTVTMGADKLSLRVSLSTLDFDNEAIRAALNLPRVLPLLPLAPEPQAANNLRERLDTIRAVRKEWRKKGGAKIPVQVE